MNENNTNMADTTNVDTEQEQPKTYTEEEVKKLLQVEADRRVTSALAKQKSKYESLSKLDEQARGVAEKDMRIQELEQKLQEYTIIQNKNEVMKVLSARGLSTQFADLITIDEDIDAAQARINALDKLFKDSVAAEVKKRLASNTPKVGANTQEELTPEKFKKLTLAQRSELYNTNPDLFRKLAK